MDQDFDWIQLEQLAGGDKAFQKELLVLFLQDTQERIRQLGSEIAAKDAAAAEASAHYIKGASLNVGAATLATLAGQIEEEVQRSRLAASMTLLQQLRHHWQTLNRLA